jgi:flagellar biosynthesis/type III secretory pathway M-ring protein FliF/YscJ
VEFLIVLAVLAVVVFIVTGPLRREYSARAREPEADPGSSEATELAELEATREAKYREIRDAELDHRTGKLSDADFEAVDRTLRAEAVEILHKLDHVRGLNAPPDSEPPEQPRVG